MKILLINETYRKQLEERAIQRSYQFSWLKMAWETLMVYEGIILSEKQGDQIIKI